MMLRACSQFLKLYACPLCTTMYTLVLASSRELYGGRRRRFRRMSNATMPMRMGCLSAFFLP